MPVSRNRKKKNNQNKAKASPFSFEELFNSHLNDCRECEGARDEFNFDDLPDEEQRHWEKSGIKESIDFFLYCSICNEFSAILEIEEL
jgi:hypothetical protein